MSTFTMYDVSDTSGVDGITPSGVDPISNMSVTLDPNNFHAIMCRNESMRNDPSCSVTTPIVMMTMGVLGNILALAVIYSCRREAQAHRTVFFVMLSGLAWTDLLGQLAVGPIAIIVYANRLEWVGGVHLCRYHGFMMTTIGLVTPLIVCSMSVERFLAIRFSYFYARHVTRQKALMTFTLCWGVTIAFCLLPFTGFGSYERQFPGSWCFLNFHRESTLDAVYAGLFSLTNIIAILIMIFCNIMVVGTLCVMRRRRQKMYSSSHSKEPRLSLSQISYNGTASRPKRHSYMEAQMIWFLCLITIAFTVCWLPLNGHILGQQFTGTFDRKLDLMFVRMASCNQILDPWLYVIFRKNFFLRLVRRLKLWFFPACASQEGILEEAMRQQQLRRPGRSRSYTVEATTIDRTAYHINRCGTSSPTYGRPWCVRNDQEDLEALKRILENEKKRPAGSDRPTPVDKLSVASLESVSCLDGLGHMTTTDEVTTCLASNTAKVDTVSLGVSPSQSLEYVSGNSICENHESECISSHDHDHNLENADKSSTNLSTQQQQKLYSKPSEKKTLYVISNPSVNGIDINGGYLNSSSNAKDKTLKQPLLPSLSYNVPSMSCSSISSEKEAVKPIPRGICLSSDSIPSTKNSVSRNESLSHTPLLRNGHVCYDGGDSKTEDESSKHIPSALEVNSFDYIDDVFDTNVDEVTMLCPSDDQHSTKHRAEYQSRGSRPL